MACTRPELTDYLGNFTIPTDAVVCPFVQDAGLGIGLAMTALLILGPLGLAMSVRIRHPGPIVVAGMLTIGAMATSLPGQAAQIAALVLFFAIVAIGFYIYQRASTSL